MVCKEEVLSWFKDLESYKRIDVVYELLNMCVPFELRFLGSCVEEIGKHTYQELRGPTITANSVEKLKKDVTFNQGLLEESVRHRVMICLSLLSSRNCLVADWLYKKLLRTDCVDEVVIKGICKNELLQNEFLLLYTMALHHPAFTFEQKQDFWGILTRLIDIRDHKIRIVNKPNVNDYPPGFQKKKNVPEAPTIVYSESLHQHHPPGLPHHMPPPPTEYFSTGPLCSRPGFAVCGAPDVAPFPAAPVSPLVSQAGSPNHSRSTSPHRTSITLRQQQQQPIPPPLIPTGNPIIPPPPLEILSQSSLPLFSTELKLPDDELSSMLEDKQLCDLPWQATPVPGLPLPPGSGDMKQNGLRFPETKLPYLVEIMQDLSLDGDKSLHHSSDNSSPIQSPPDTPTVMPHAPGRGLPDTKGGTVRVNGMPFTQTAAPAAPPPPPPAAAICDATSPPPTAFNNCSVPYSYPQTFTTMPPQANRSFIHFNSFRPTYTAHYPTYQTENTFPNYPIPYIPVMYSSPPLQNRTGCYNCGSPGHVGSECTAQNIEEITQKKTYQLEFAATLPDGEK